ncbi:MAG: 50S ribosomal protein L23 [Candidatus Pacearchaeota archaeon]
MKPLLEPISTEKAVMKIEAENTLTFRTNKESGKEDIRKEIEELFEVKVDKVRTFIRGNKKYAYVKLNKSSVALDTATKLGIM